MQFIVDAEAHLHGLADHGDSPVAVLDRGDRCLWYAGRAGSSKSFARCVQRQVPSTAAVHQRGRRHPRRGAEAFPWSKLFVRSCFTRCRCPFLQVVQIFPVVVQRQIHSHGLYVQQAMETPPVARGQGGRCPYLQVVRVPVPCVDRFVRHEGRSQLLVGSRAQAQGHGFPPSGRGRGGGDAWSLLPDVLPPELDACLCHIDRDMSVTHVSEPPPPPVVLPQLQSAEAVPHGPVYSADHRDSPVAVRFQVVDVHVMRVVQFLRWQKTAVIPQLQFITVVDAPFVAQMLIPMILATMECPSCVWTERSMPLLCRSCRSLELPSRHRDRSPWSL